MGKKVKKIVSLFLALILCVTLIPTQNYVDKVMAADGAVVVLANKDISSGGYYLNDGKGGITSEGASAENYNLYYDGNGQMVLNGLDITQRSYLEELSMPGDCGIYATTSLDISVIGENQIDMSVGSSYGHKYGIYTSSNVTIKGSGNLYVYSVFSLNSNAYGIYTGGSLVIEADVEAVGESDSSSSTYKGCGIYSVGKLTVGDSEVSAKGSSYGVYATSGITIEKLAQLSAASTGSRACEGISGKVAVDSGTVIAEREGTGKCFTSVPSFSGDYWWRNYSEGNYLENNYIDENMKYSEFTTIEPQEIAFTYVTLQGNGGLIDGLASRTVLTDSEGRITKVLLGAEPVYYNMYLEGWFTDGAFTNQVDIYQTTFSEPVTLYAKWNSIEVTLGEIDVSKGGYWLNDGVGGLMQEGANASNYNVYYDGEGELILKDADITGVYKQVSSQASLHFRVPMTVTLIGENVIQRTTGAGAYALKDTVFQGAGTLRLVEADTAKASGSRCFWFIYGLTIDEAKLYVDGTQTAYGASVNNLTVKNGGGLEVCGGEANTSSYHSAYGIYVGDTLNLSNGTVKGIGGEACYTSDHTYSYGVYANKIVVSGGKLEGIAGKVSRDEAWSSSPNYCSNGIYAKTSIDVSGGEVIGVGNDVNSLNSYAWTYGISVGNGGTMSMTDGKVTGQCGNTRPSTATLVRQFGLYNVALNMTGGELILEHGMNKAPSALPEEYRWRTSSTGTFTSSSNTAYKFGSNSYLQITSGDIISKVTGYTLSLNGDIGVNIHMSFTDDVLDDENAFVRVSFVDGKVLEKVIEELDIRTIGGKENYIFTCNVQAPEMNDEFAVELITSAETLQLDTYSVKAYGDYVLNHIDDSEDYAKVAPTVRAMLNYGGYSQKQFGHNTNALANAGLYGASEDPVLVGAVPSLSEYAFTAPNKNVGVKYYGTSLLLNSETTIRHYFTFTEGEDITEIREKYEFKLADGTLLAPVMRGGMIYIDIRNINAADLDVKYEVTVTNKMTSETFTFSYSALSYAKYVLDYALAGTNLVNVIKAMYFYNEAANAYFQ